MKTQIIAAVSLTLFAATSNAANVTNVEGVSATNDVFVSRFERGLTADQEAARKEAARRNEQEMRAIVEGAKESEKTATWRIKRLDAQEGVKVATWRIKR